MDGQVPAEPQEKDMAECGAGEQQEEPVMRVGEQLEELEEAGAPAMNVGEQQEAPGTGQEAVALAEKHAGEEPKAAEAPAMDVGEQQEAPGRGQVAEESEAKGAEEKENVGIRVCKRRGDDVMATQAAGEPQEASVMGQEAASEHLGQEPEEAGAPGDEEAGGDEAGAPADEAPHLFFVLKRKFFDVMVTGEKKVEYREKKRHYERQMIDEDGQFKKFEYVEFQCAYSHPLRRFRAGFVDVSIVNEHAQRWSNGAVVAFKDTPTYAIRLGPVLGSPYLAPRKEKEAVGPATPKKRGGSVALDSPGTGRKASRKSGREAVSTAKCDQRGSRRGVQVHARL